MDDMNPHNGLTYIMVGAVVNAAFFEHLEMRTELPAPTRR